MGKPVARDYFDAVGKSADPGVACPEESLAVQSAKDECDINVIVKKYLRTGELPGVRQGAFLDISGMVDLRDALHMVNEAQQAFMELPADVRREFDNDPVKLVEFAHSNDPRDRERAIKLGLIEAPKPGETPSPAPTSSAAATAEPAVPPKTT